MAGGGRPAGPLRGETPQAAELAIWLKSLTRGLTLRDLEERFQYRRTQWGEFRSGAKLIPSWLLDDLVRALVPEPRLQAQTLAKGRKLLADAELAAAGKLMPATPPGPGPASAAEVQIRLDDARRGQLQAERAMFGLTQIIMNLLGMIALLQDRCRILEAEQERVSAAGPPEAEAAVQDELNQTRRVIDHAHTQREAAQAEREQAEDIRIAAQLLQAQHLRDLQRHAQAQDLEPAPPDGQESEPAVGPHGLELVPLYEFDAVLEHQDGLLATAGRALDEVREDLDLAVPAPAGDPGIVRGQVLDGSHQTGHGEDRAEGTQAAVQEARLSAGDADNPDIRTLASEPSTAPESPRVSVPYYPLSGRETVALGALAVLLISVLVAVAVQTGALHLYWWTGRTPDPLASSSNKPTPISTMSSSPMGTEQARLPVGTSVPPCTPSAVKLSLSASRNAYATGQHPLFRVRATNSTSTGCALDLSPSKADLTITRAPDNDPVYASKDCPGPEVSYMVPAHGDLLYARDWDTKATGSGCALSVAPSSAGAYLVTFAVRGYPSQSASFVLLPS